MLKHLNKISGSTLFSNPYWEYRYDKYEMPDGNTGDYWYVHTLGATMIIPVTAEGNIVLVKQYRYLNSKVSIEFPGGGLEKGITPEENAKKELLEETGFEAGIISKIGEFNPYNGVTDEICHVYVAKELIAREKHNEASEQIENLIVNSEELNELIRNGKLWDGMTMASWQLYQSSLLS